MEESKKLITSWARIKHWLSENYPETLENLYSPAFDSQIEAAESTIGLRFPDALRTLLMAHNGEDHHWPPGIFPGGHRFLPTEDIVETWYKLKDYNDAAPENWLPISASRSNSIRFLDFNPPQGGTVGQVVEVDFNLQTYDVLADSFVNYIENYAIDLAVNKYAVVGDDILLDDNALNNSMPDAAFLDEELEELNEELNAELNEALNVQFNEQLDEELPDSDFALDEKLLASLNDDLSDDSLLNNDLVNDYLLNDEALIKDFQDEPQDIVHQNAQAEIRNDAPKAQSPVEHSAQTNHKGEGKQRPQHHAQHTIQRNAQDHRLNHHKNESQQSHKTQSRNQSTAQNDVPTLNKPVRKAPASAPIKSPANNPAKPAARKAVAQANPVPAKPAAPKVPQTVERTAANPPAPIAKPVADRLESGERLIIVGEMTSLMGKEEMLFSVETEHAKEYTFLAKASFTKGFSDIAIDQYVRVLAKKFHGEIKSHFIEQGLAKYPDYVAFDYVVLPVEKPSTNKTSLLPPPENIDQIAHSILQSIQVSFQRGADYKEVKPDQSPYVHSKFYTDCTQRLLKLGFHYTADLEDPHASVKGPHITPPFFRVMSFFDDGIVANFYHIKPKFSWPFQTTRKVIEFETELSDGNIIISTTAEDGADFPLPKTITRHVHPPGIPLEGLLHKHRSKIRRYQTHKPESAIVKVRSKKEFVALRQRRQQMIYNHLRSIGWVTKEYVAKQFNNKEVAEQVYARIKQFAGTKV